MRLPTRPVFRQYIPCKPLSDFAAFFWYWEDDLPCIMERILPTGTVDVVIGQGNDGASECVVSGPRSRPLILNTTANRLLGIRFNPGGAFPFFGIPVSDLHNLTINLADVWGEENAQRLVILLNQSTTIDSKFSALEKWLEQICRNPMSHHRAVVFALRQFYSGR